MSAAHDSHSHLASPRWERSWLTTASRLRMGGAALCAGIIVFILIGLIDVLLVNTGAPRFAIVLASATFSAFLAFALTLKVLLEVHERREALRAQLRVIGETNHHIRNALELIQFSAHATKDQQIVDQISSAVDRIQWVLRELLGETGSYQQSGQQSDSPSKLTNK